jgi:hypothetical protein
MAALAIIGTTFAPSSVLAQMTNVTTTTTTIVEDNATSLATRIQITKDATNYTQSLKDLSELAVLILFTR